jgi:hypothetical protein
MTREIRHHDREELVLGRYRGWQRRVLMGNTHQSQWFWSTCGRMRYVVASASCRKARAPFAGPTVFHTGLEESEGVCSVRAPDGPPTVLARVGEQAGTPCTGTQWPSCWCRQRGQALTQKPGGITFQTLARREDRQRRTRGWSGTAADRSWRSAIRVAPERGLQGGRNPRHGQSAAAPVPAL